MPELEDKGTEEITMTFTFTSFNCTYCISPLRTYAAIFLENKCESKKAEHILRQYIIRYCYLT